VKFISWNKNQNLFEANYDRRWWGATRMGLAKEKIISFYNILQWTVSSVTLSSFIFAVLASAKRNESCFGSFENSWSKARARMRTVTQWLVLGFSAHAYMIFLSCFNLHRIWPFLWNFWFWHNFFFIHPVCKRNDHFFGCFLEHSMQNSPTSKT